MAIYDTYAALITENIIQEILEDGDTPSVSEISERFDEYTEANDISGPVFSTNNYSVVTSEAASVTKFNNTNNAIQQDLTVLYRHLFKVSDQTINNFHRWRTESSLLEGRLDALEERIVSLLLLEKDTAGYFNFMQDNFVDNSKVDLANTTAYVNTDKGTVSLGTSSIGATRIDLSALVDKDIVFTVLSRNNLVSTASAQGSRTQYIITDVNNYWQERVYTNKPGPVSVEVVIDLGEEFDISRIDVDLHMSNQNSTAQVTPMYSTDNYNFSQVPTTNYTRSIVDKSTFQFSAVTARYIKLIMTKTGYDQVHNELYAYEFGIDEVSFYEESFAEDTDSILVSQALSVTDTDGNREQFSRIVLEVCEDVPADTTIDYYVAASNDTNDSLAGFTQIQPISRDSTLGSKAPTVIDFGELDTVTVSGITVSYNPSADSGININPAETFVFISGTSGTTATTASGFSSGPRYSFLNSNERILNYQVGSGVQIAQGTLELWRNISVKGNETKVRGYTNGWGFEDPYYQTTVYVDNAEGHDVDFGGESAVIDGTPRSGKVTVDKGQHRIWVHKDNWKYIDRTTVSGLSSLKLVDGLYPYNHRYLVEGLEYPTGWPTTETKVYKGFDIVGEYLMQEVSIFDLINNVSTDDYSRFARDEDVTDASRLLDGIAATDTTPTTVFVFKADEANSDFINEQFMLRFKSATSLFQYLRFKAVLNTEDSNITPFLDSYRIKISS